MSVVWVIESVVLALHEEHLAEHGGAVGICDRGLLESALFRPRNLANDDYRIWRHWLLPMASVLPVIILSLTATNGQH
jgi:prophage maintenance system killer protein